MNPLDFGVQSYCFRHFKDNQDVARMVREIGINKIELCAVHADFNDPSGFQSVADLYRDAGVQIVSIGVQTCHGHPGEERWFECAARAGAKHMSIHLDVATHVTALPKLRHWSRQHGVKLGLHTHGGYMFGGSPDVVEHLLGLGGPELGVCIATAWCMQIGPRQGNPVSWAERFAGRIHGIHYKDFVFEPNAAWHDVIVGEGNLPLADFVRALQNAQFDGMAVIEYEADVENPVPALQRCVARMRELTA